MDVGLRGWVSRLALVRMLKGGLLRSATRRPLSSHALRKSSEALEARLMLTVFTVQNLNDSGAGSLRAAVGASQQGDSIEFAKKLKGTITLTTGQIDIDHDLTIQGTGASKIKISGNGASRIFRVIDLDNTDTEVPDVAISSLSLVQGRATADAATSGQAAGGAIAFLAPGGDLVLTNVTLSGNRADGAGGFDAAGGAIYYLSKGFHSVSLTNCLVTGNLALGGEDGGLALGGAVAAITSTGLSTGDIALVTEGTIFRSNQAVGGDGGIERTSSLLPGVGQVGSALGGAVAAVGVRYFLSTSTFADNSALAGSGGSSDLSVGGMTFSRSFVATAGGGAAAGVGFGNINRQFVQQSTFTGNAAIGGSNAVGKAPGALSTLSTVGSGLGGAEFVFGCQATTANSTFRSSTAIGGNQNSADAQGTVPPMVGNGRGGAIYIGGESSRLTVANSLVEQNAARGGSGGFTSQYSELFGDDGPLNSAAGGGIQSDAIDTASLGIQNTIVRNNEARGGSGGDGPRTGAAYGGGIGRMAGGFTFLEGATVTGNSAIAADGVEGIGSETGGNALGGGVYSPGSDDITTLSKISGNRAVAGSGAGFGNGGTARGGGGVMSGKFVETEIDGNVVQAGSVTGLGYLGSAWGGGLETAYGANLDRCSIINNSSLYGGGIYNRYGQLELTNSTIAQNTAALGGGFYLGHYDATFKSDLTLTNVTIARNVANDPAELGDAGAAVYTDFRDNEAVIRNSIIADNTGVVWGGERFGIAYNISGDFNYWDQVFIQDGGLHTIVKTFQPETEILLGTLGYYGGQTQTIPLLPGSAAIDSGEVNGLATDQRGIARPQNATPDRGAFESQGFRISIVSGNNQSAGIGKRFARPLVVKVSANNPIEPVEGGVVTFTPPASGASAELAPGRRVTITKTKRVSVTATANRVKGKYTLRAGGQGFNVPAEFILNNK